MTKSRPIVFLLTLLFTAYSYAYNYLPVVKSYEKESYHAGRQNWDLETDSKGVIYIANDQGLLRYVFGQWELATTTNNDIVRSICVYNDTIWCAGATEYGYFVKDSPENLKYHRLGSVAEGIVWDVECKDNYVYYQAEGSIVAYDKREQQSHTLKLNNGFWDLALWNNAVWTVDRLGNIGYISGYEFVPVTGVKAILQWEIRKLFVHNNDLFILVFDGRLFKYNGQNIEQVVLPKGLAGEACFCADSYKDNKVLVGTISKGLVEVDLDKNTVEQPIDRSSGLLDNTVLAIGKDMNGNVWLGLDYGLAFVEMRNPLKNIFEGGATYAIVDKDEATYLATNKGLFYSKGKTLFQIIEGSDGQNWNIRKINDEIYLCHNKGVFILKGGKLHPLFTDNGVEDIARFGDSPYFLLSAYYGFLLVKYQDDQLVVVKKLEIWGNPKIEYDADNKCIWASTPQSGLVQLKFNAENDLEQESLLPMTNYFKGESRFVFYDNQTLMAYKNGLFTPIDEKPFSLISGAGISALDFDKNSNLIAYVQDGYPNLLSNLYDGNFYSYYKLLSSLKNSLLQNYEFIELQNKELRVATEKGVTTFNINTENVTPVTKAVISKITVSENNTTKSFLYPYVADHLTLDKGYKGLIFHFGTNKSSSDLAEFRFRLLPFESGWSQWSSSRTVKEYSKIKGGDYEFHLQCRLNGGEIKESFIHVNIEKYWYQTSWVLLPIFLFLTLITFVISKLMRHRHDLKIKKEQKAHKEELAIKTLGFKNEQLLQYTEVISSKNEFLNRLKDGLSRMRNSEARHWENKIEEEVNKEKKNFLFHKLFSEVHQDFINRLTEKHTNLTANDIRIVSFIRINLGTKEIANLMNISPKSVDIARYRLRKKLDLAHEADLNKYIREI